MQTIKAQMDRALAAAKETRQLEIGRDLLDSVPTIFRNQFGKRAAAIVADTNTFRVAGERVKAAFVAAGHAMVEPYVLTDPALYAESKYVEMVQQWLATHDAIPVAVGSGTINDLCKLAAHRVGRQYLCVATAASMDGYTAFGASITHDGHKQTFTCPAPQAVVADLDVIAAAPKSMTASGYADLLAKLTAGADWIVADALGVEAIDPAAWETVQGSLPEALATPVDIARLTEGLLMGGFAMQAAQSSRPASGAEHQFSHLWDMQHHTHNGKAPSHGFKVGVATLAVARFYEQLLQLPLESLDVEKAVAAWPDRAQLVASIEELFPAGEVRDVAMKEALHKHVEPADLRKQLQRLRTVWRDLVPRLRKQLPPADEMSRRLAAVGAPTGPEEIGISQDRLRASFHLAYFIRRRFTVLDLAVRANVLDQVLDRQFTARQA